MPIENWRRMGMRMTRRIAMPSLHHPRTPALASRPTQRYRPTEVQTTAPRIHTAARETPCDAKTTNALLKTTDMTQATELPCSADFSSTDSSFIINAMHTQQAQRRSVPDSAPPGRLSPLRPSTCLRAVTPIHASCILRLHPPPASSAPAPASVHKKRGIPNPECPPHWYRECV